MSKSAAQAGLAATAILTFGSVSIPDAYKIVAARAEWETELSAKGEDAETDLPEASS
jgi:hypothetical protein